MKITVLLLVFIISRASAIDYKFPDDFLFGVSTAAYQVEGAWNESGKGENIWDYLIHNRPGLIRDGSNADVACDSYHKYKEDIALVKNANLKSYRFSISWARIMPSGESNFINQEGIAHYNRVINELIANGIEPIVTMYHLDLPQYLQNLGGWVNPIMSNYFVEYARILFTYFGDRVKWWITLNEPMESAKSYTFCPYAPCLHLNNTGYYLTVHTQLIAHAKAYRLYEKDFKSEQRGKISISVSGIYFMPKDPKSSDDIEAAERANQFERGVFSHPVYKGDYPPIVRQWVDKKSKVEGRPWSKLPTFTKDEIKLINGTADYYALNHYSTRYVTNGVDSDPNYNPDAEYVTSTDASWPPNISPWIIAVPDGLRQTLVWIKNEYDNPPLIITENGICDNGQLDDFDRINFIRDYLNATLHAMYEDHCNVIGYSVWSLLDNFEWMDGYRYHFGLVKVDFNDPQRSRTPKESYKFYKNVASTRSIN